MCKATKIMLQALGRCSLEIAAIKEKMSGKTVDEKVY